MQFFGKEIPVDKINFVTNIVSFILGVIFFIRMQYKLGEQAPSAIIINPERDSLIAIQTRVNTQLNEIKKIQDSIIKTIQWNETKLLQSKADAVKKRQSIYSTINSDWELLDTESKNKFIEDKLNQLKKP